jgi:dTDP-4-amino-4,6-dideoxygalactose transaminase
VIPLARPDVGPREEELVLEVLRSGLLSLGPVGRRFEEDFAAWVGTRFAAGVSSGTAGLHLAVRLAGVGPGDEVITSPFSFVASANCALYEGATPVFADIDPVTFNIDPVAVEAAITPRTRAIVPVHLYGQAADMLEIMAVADRHRLVVIEDCCQAHLATCNGLPVGTIGAAGAFSFYPTKNLGAVGDGGAVITSDGALADRVRLLRNGGQTNRYMHAVAGVNSRLDELQAAVLRARLPNLVQETGLRRMHAAFYRDALTGQVAPVAERDAGHVYHLFPVRSARRDVLQAHLARAGVETLIHYPIPLHKQPAFAQLTPRDCPVAARAAAELLSLPLHPRLHQRQAARVVDAIEAFEKGSIDA